MEYNTPTTNNLVKDVTKLVISENRCYGMTESANLNPAVEDKFWSDLTYDGEFVLQALLAMKAMNDNSLEGVMLRIPKVPYPLILDNHIQCYLIAPIVRVL